VFFGTQDDGKSPEKFCELCVIGDTHTLIEASKEIGLEVNREN
jgi:hypothetical protein